MPKQSPGAKDLPKLKLEELNFDEVLLLNNALNEILNGPHAVAEPDFQTRTGVSPDMARRLLDRLQRALSDRKARSH